MYHFGKNAYIELNQWIEDYSPSRILIIDDENTHKYCYTILKNELKTEPISLTIPPGEENKTLESVQKLLIDMMDAGLDRKSLVLNLGGGIVTDTGGFVASIFKRGIPFIHIPTTLLGMVDASIGGKNGVNLAGAKNQIGVIVPPEKILIDNRYLATLPEDEYLSGYAEMLKHGLIADMNYYNELIHSTPHSDSIIDLIKKSVKIKHNIVTKDPKEKGLRKILNFGHTLGHAIESYSYEKDLPLSHGHSVALGMILASYLSHLKFNLEFTFVNGLKNELLQTYPVPKWDKQDVKQILSYLKHDKKNVSGEVLFVLLEKPGKPVWDQRLTTRQIDEAFHFLLS